MIEIEHFPAPSSTSHHRQMIPTLPPSNDVSARTLGVGSERADVWSAITVPPAREHADRHIHQEEAPIERPAGGSPRRLLTVSVAVAVVAIALLFPAIGETDGFTDEDHRSLSAVLVLSYLVSLATFGWWSHDQRMTIDALRWRSFRRPTWSWWWTVAWVGTPLVALVAAVGISFVTPNRIWLVGLAVVLVIARMMVLQSLGTNMSRVVRGAKRWLPLWGLATGVVDVLMIDIAITGVVDTRVEPGRLDDLVAWLLPLLVVHTLFVLSYMKRVERWVLEWWDQRYGISDEEVLAVLATIRHGERATESYRGRRLVPTAPFRLAVIVAYLALAGTACWNAANVWTLRDDLTLAADRAAAVEVLGFSVSAFLIALVAVQVVQGMWSMVAAWNARRCTVAAPSVVGLLVLFLAAPAMCVYALVVSGDNGARITLIGVALLLNLACWALSFSVLSQTIEVLGRSSDRLGRWGVIVSLHWVLLFVFRPFERIGDDRVYAAAVVVVSLIDAAIFVAASGAAWRAMRHFDVATREYEQVRRVRI